MKRGSQHLHVGSCIHLQSFARRSISLLTVVAVTLAGCSNYKAVLQYAPGGKAEVAAEDTAADVPRFVLPTDFELRPDTVLLPPAPVKAERVIKGKPKLTQNSGWVEFRFDVDDTGRIGDVEVMRSSRETIEFAARQILDEWAFTPATVDGRPVAFQNMGAIMGFSDTVTPGEAVGVIVLLPLALIALAVSAAVGMGGSFKSN